MNKINFTNTYTLQQTRLGITGKYKSRLHEDELGWGLAYSTDIPRTYPFRNLSWSLDYCCWMGFGQWWING